MKDTPEEHEEETTEVTIVEAETSFVADETFEVAEEFEAV